jgi:hypothetical protein
MQTKNFIKPSGFLITINRREQFIDLGIVGSSSKKTN